MPIVPVPNTVGLEFHYYNFTDDDDYNHENYKNQTIQQSFASFLISFILICFLIQLVRCCVSITQGHNKKLKFRRLNHLNVSREGVNDQCPICFDPISDKFVLECGHAFNKNCLYSWVETSIENNSFKCPLCNTVYTIN